MNHNLENKIRTALRQVAQEARHKSPEDIEREFTGLFRSLAKEEAVELADHLIGKEIEVLYEYKDIRDDDSCPEPGTLAVNTFQRAQRRELARYQQETQTQVPELVMADRSVNEE